ncbi:MAG: Rieske 2Fe-2S domain-containing protein [Methanococcoides sp.]|nr:Rieske 2Fe-2S domain-containing protein [Methanococcoides sp.]
MTGYTELCSSEDVQDGEMRSFDSGDNKILVVNLGGKFYAIDAICNHMGGKLVDGKLKDNIVICPRHKCEYDVTSGKIKKKAGFFVQAFSGKCNDQISYATKVEGGKIYVDI